MLSKAAYYHPSHRPPLRSSSAAIASVAAVAAAAAAAFERSGANSGPARLWNVSDVCADAAAAAAAAAKAE